MPVNLAFALPLADIFILGAIGFFAFSGFMRGALRTLFSLLRIYFSFIITVLFYERLALLAQAMIDMPAWLAQIISFVIVFGVVLTIIWIAGAILIKRIAKPPQTSSSLNKIGGTVLGLVEGIFIVSVIIMCIDFYPAHNDARSPMEDAISYKFIKYIAPSIKDFTMNPVSRLRNIANGSKSG
jgi:uncharacterized membrane protein required for colicin V production